MAVYVYGVVAAAERTRVTSPGVGGGDEKVRRVVHGALAALVSDVEPAPLAAARDLRAHWRVLEEVAREGTVLPVRFGTVMESEEALVEEFLEPRADRLTENLRQLAGKVQLSVKGFYEQEPLMRGVIQRSPAVARMRERVRGRPQAATYYDRIRLGELVASEVEQTREHDAAQILGKLEPLAVASRREPPTTPEGAVNAAFLVEREGVDEFSRVVAELAQEVEGYMRLRYIGPLPPYSFTEEETAAWA